MDVRVHADAGLVVAHGHDEVGRLAAHALEREQVVDLVGHAAGEALEEVPADPEDHAGLRAVETDGEDQRLDPLGRQPEHRCGRVGHGEEALGGGPGRRVLGPQREDARDQHAKRIAITVGDDGERRRVPAWRRPAQTPEDPPDGYRWSLMDSSSCVARG